MKFEKVVDIVDLYRQCGEHMYDEEVSQTTHAVQCARRAQGDGASADLALAALLHDVGHLLEIRAQESAHVVTERDLRHQDSGSHALSELFGPLVIEPIKWHVEAKRYLCATDSKYAGSLSAGSTASLALQGGPMTAEECSQFLAQPQSADAIRLRRWDDLGKDTDNSPSSIDEFEHLLYLFVGELAN